MSGLRFSEIVLSSHLKNGIAHLEQGSHACFVYETLADQVTALAQFVSEGLGRNEHCFCIQQPHTLKLVEQSLLALGIDAKREQRNGNLAFSTVKDAYLPDGRFDAARMIRSLKEIAGRAKDRGFSVVRAAGDVSWATEHLAGDDDLLAYEKMVEEFYSATGGIGFCQYNRKRFHRSTIKKSMRAHGTSIFQAHATDRWHVRLRADGFFADVQPSKSERAPSYHYYVQHDGSAEVLGLGQSESFAAAKVEAEFLLQQYAARARSKLAQASA